MKIVTELDASTRRIMKGWEFRINPQNNLLVAYCDDTDRIELGIRAKGNAWPECVGCDSAEQLEFIAIELLRITEEIKQNRKGR